MKEIVLTRGKIAIVDDEMYDKLNKHKWRVVRAHKVFYAVREKPKERGRTIWMHREVLNTPKNMETDHIDGNGLNNQKNNLRICTHQQNAWNQGVKCSNTTGFKGVKFDIIRGKYFTEIRINGKKKFIGRFSSPIEASMAYNKMAIKIHGKFAHKI